MGEIWRCASHQGQIPDVLPARPAAEKAAGPAHAYALSMPNCDVILSRTFPILEKLGRRLTHVRGACVSVERVPAGAAATPAAGGR